MFVYVQPGWKNVSDSFLPMSIEGFQSFVYIVSELKSEQK